MSYAIELKICAITAGIKKYNSIIKKKKKKYDKILLLGQPKLNRIAILIFKVLIDSNITSDKFVLMNNVLKKYDDMKKQMKNLKN